MRATLFAKKRFPEWISSTPAHQQLEVIGCLIPALLYPSRFGRHNEATPFFAAFRADPTQIALIL
ncbi:hypothetical protein Pla110_00130 [Polystyrenella longa]|uniref:Uncharacterized protein n=1 Tax=Polystyrenella longa TaxID=2528007 RepID=A0A518CGG3_9PLAN|nr:hypothetical protein Pla110_00130 [Polystyrenella longa]